MDQLSRFASLDDLWSVLGYALLTGINSYGTHSMTFPTISLLASAMLALLWAASPNIRARNAERYPNARIVFWAAVALTSLFFALR
jgi:hypothetical protein